MLTNFLPVQDPIQSLIQMSIKTFAKWHQSGSAGAHLVILPKSGYAREKMTTLIKNGSINFFLS